MVLNKDELNEGMLTWADQVICAKNDTRTKLNMQMKQLLGKGTEPCEGDKIICLRNYWETISNTENPLVNGTIGTFHNFFSTYIQYPSSLGGLKVPYLDGTFVSDSEDRFTIGIDEISGVIQTNSATAEESAATSEELTAQAKTLQNMAQYFKID